MNLRTPRLSPFLAAALPGALALAIALLSPSATAQNAKTEASAKALQKEAIEKHYLTLDFAKAQSTLEKAANMCGTDKCSAGLRANLRRDQGVVHIAAGEKDKGIESFKEAIKIDPNVQLDPDLKNADNQAAFDAAKKGGGGGGGGGGGAGQPSGDFTHTPVPEQQIRTAIPVYVEYSGEEALIKVIVRYKGFGMTEWKSVDLKKMGEKGWGGQLPCGDVQQGKSQYYIQGFNANNDPVATAGDRNNPYKVDVKRDAVAEPPHLPNTAAPTQCADTGDCPPNFPGCKKAGVAPAASEEPKGKDGGEYCEEDSECKSGKCDTNKCTDYKGASKAPKVWVGLWGAVDYSFLPSADDVCKLSSTRDGQLPLNSENYYCTQGSDDYPFRQVQGATNPRDSENTNLIPGTSDKVSGGGAIGNIRIMASLDYALNNNMLIGARLGYVLNSYSGQAAKDDGKTFAPIHLELRGTYLIGQDALEKKLVPYVFVAGGASTFDAAVKVSVVEQQNTKKVAKDVDAWHIGGPGFLAFGGGVRVAFSPRAAFMGGLRANLAFGNSFAPSVGPELGVMMGF